jgi:hypothetical protein
VWWQASRKLGHGSPKVDPFIAMRGSRRNEMHRPFTGRRETDRRFSAFWCPMKAPASDL